MPMTPERVRRAVNMLIGFWAAGGIAFGVGFGGWAWLATLPLSFLAYGAGYGIRQLEEKGKL